MDKISLSKEIHGRAIEFYTWLHDALESEGLLEAGPFDVDSEVEDFMVGLAHCYGLEAYNLGDKE